MLLSHRKSGSRAALRTDLQPRRILLTSSSIEMNSKFLSVERSVRGAGAKRWTHPESRTWARIVRTCSSKQRRPRPRRLRRPSWTSRLCWANRECLRMIRRKMTRKQMRVTLSMRMISIRMITWNLKAIQRCRRKSTSWCENKSRRDRISWWTISIWIITARALLIAARNQARKILSSRSKGWRGPKRRMKIHWASSLISKRSTRTNSRRRLKI